MGRSRRFRRTTLLSLGLAAWLLGLVLARRVQFANALVALGLVLALVPLLYFRSKLSMLSITILGLLLGCYRGTVFRQELLPYQTLTKQPMVILAVAKSDAVYGDKSQLEFDVGDVKLVEPYSRSLVGKIGVKGYGPAMVYRGDRVRVEAKLYPSRGAKQASLSFATINRIAADTSVVNRWCRQFAAGLQSVVPEPLGSFGLGILTGQRTTLPDRLNDQLSVVGLTHIVAVSGYNLTIMVGLAHRLARNRSKFQAIVLTLGLIGLFLLITGKSASIVRAAIVSGLGIVAWYYGRTFRPHLLILLGAGLTAGWFPAYLWSDLGWHLSFLAFSGVLILAPMFKARFMKARQPKILLQLLLETTAAQIMTLPIIMYIFGRVSLIALLANVLVVPLIPIAMALSFVAGLAGWLIPSLAGWLAWPATLALTYMIDIVQLMADLPHASIGQTINWQQLTAAYALIVVIMVMWWHNKNKNGKITDRNTDSSQPVILGEI